MMDISEIKAAFEDVNACASDGLEALSADRLDELRTLLRAITDVAREAISELENDEKP